MLRFLKRAIRRQKESLDGSAYTTVQNLQSVFKSGAVKFGYRPPIYWCADRDTRLYFAAKTRSKLYRRGIDHRLWVIARDYMLDEIPLEDGDTVIDCGANIGEFGLAIARKGTRIRYVGFEPGPSEFACLKRNIPEGDLRQTALWYEKAELTFYLDPTRADSSLIDTGRSDSQVTVPCVRLDEVLPRQPIKLLKIEAEGAEPEALAGSEKLLDQCSYIVVDAGPERGSDNQETTAEVVNFLVRRGFDLVRIRHSRVVLLFSRAHQP